jgi:hypothetical protein
MYQWDNQWRMKIVVNLWWSYLHIQDSIEIWLFFVMVHPMTMKIWGFCRCWNLMYTLFDLCNAMLGNRRCRLIWMIVVRRRTLRTIRECIAQILPIQMFLNSSLSFHLMMESIFPA